MGLNKFVFVALSMWSALELYQNFSVDLDSSFILLCRFLSLGAAMMRFIGSICAVHYIDEITKSNESRSHVQSLFFFSVILSTAVYIIWGQHLDQLKHENLLILQNFEKVRAKDYLAVNNQLIKDIDINRDDLLTKAVFQLVLVNLLNF